MNPVIHIVGILDDGWGGLSETARGALSGAQLVIGADGRAVYTDQNCEAIGATESEWRELA